MSDLTVEQIAAAVLRSAATLATDPVSRPYSSDTIGRVHKAVCLAMAGAGTEKVIAERLADDPTLADIPVTVVSALLTPSLTHFARALKSAEATR